ncbi:hypothetical protein CLOHYLEM_06332 [[Clostridium] hylemonae DSM 15053]|uniref:Uncharacterized protein n=1 Tax=[Clostridium] hylemonae DSM 15053 TaxID=553973 RepID=C0C2M7_9FIRM|nr:hypothetical protein CLOHYLEM_06332 [[Clostridium] hylemonae DSM 15053]
MISSFFIAVASFFIICLPVISFRYNSDDGTDGYKKERFPQWKTPSFFDVSYYTRVEIFVNTILMKI